MIASQERFLFLKLIVFLLDAWQDLPDKKGK